jgi:hypothetical protein
VVEVVVRGATSRDSPLASAVVRRVGVSEQPMQLREEEDDDAAAAVTLGAASVCFVDAVDVALKASESARVTLVVLLAGAD